MCIATPVQLASVDGVVGAAADGTAVDLSLVPEAVPGDWVLVFLGSARRIVDADEAALMLDALHGVASVMAGTAVDLDSLFADLVDREPELPPHLEAARAAGLTEA